MLALLAWIRRFFAAPVFEDEEKARIASLLNTMVQTVFVTAIVMLVVFTIVAPDFWTDPFNQVTVPAVMVAILGLRFLIHRGNIQLASVLFSFTIFGVLTFSLYSFNGIRSADTGSFFLVIIIAGLLLGGRAAIIFAILSASSVGAVWYAEVNGIVVRHIPAVPGSYELVTYSVMFCLVALLLRYAANSINRALEHAQRNERAEAESNRELQKIRASLEQRVAERTANLERRTAQLHAATEVGRGVTTVLEVDRLIQQVVDLIREQFDLHYVGLFLVDETSQWAILRAGTGEVGRALLARNHRLPINSNSIICQCIVNSQARVSAETGTQGAPRSDAAELPAARSEAALPLRSRGQVIGAISVYSEQPAAFDPDTVAILQTVSDQVAVALDNARLFAQSREALEATRRAYSEQSQQAWIELARARPDLSLRKDEYGISPASDVWQPEMETALQTGRVMPGQDEAAAVAAPIKVRGQVIGVIDARKPEHGKKWTSEEVALLETLVEQLGVAMDSARLHQEAQSHAAREQAINTITTRIRSALTVNTILQRAAEELGRSFGASRASIRLEADRGDKHA